MLTRQRGALRASVLDDRISRWWPSTLLAGTAAGHRRPQGERATIQLSTVEVSYCVIRLTAVSEAHEGVTAWLMITPVDGNDHLVHRKAATFEELTQTGLGSLSGHVSDEQGDRHHDLTALVHLAARAVLGLPSSRTSRQTPHSDVVIAHDVRTVNDRIVGITGLHFELNELFTKHAYSLP